MVRCPRAFVRTRKEKKATRFDPGGLFVPATIHSSLQKNEFPRHFVAAGPEVKEANSGRKTPSGLLSSVAITNTRLSVSCDGETISLFQGDSLEVSRYRVTCLTSQDVVYTSACADAGLNGVSFIIERTDR